MMASNLEKNAAKLHQFHAKNIDNLIVQRDERFFVLKNKDCVGYKLNIRTLDLLTPLLKTKNTWLTIGDYNGFEAQYFSEKNQDVLATDISGTFLKEAYNQNLINRFQVENVEYLSFKEDSFDYVSCREAFHHFPRAYLGLYEMIRVAKKGVIIIEPIDPIQIIPLLLFLKNILDCFNPLLINKIWKNRFSWEIVGNYVFKISEREIEKIAMGINLPFIAFKGINVLLQINDNTYEVPHNKKIWKKLIAKINRKNFLCKLGLIPYNTLCSIIFKEMPTEDELLELKKLGYKLIPLPKNPYI